MAKRKNSEPKPPCAHYDNLIGVASAGNFHTDPDGWYLAVVTCFDCVTASNEYVSAMTGRPPNPVDTYTDRKVAA